VFSSVSLGCFIFSLIGIFPPWELFNLPFWLVLGATQAFFWFSPDFLHEGFGGSVIVTIAVYQFDHPASAGRGLGIFGSVAVWANICFLFPRLITGKDGV
jgi:hypothetical protein